MKTIDILTKSVLGLSVAGIIAASCSTNGLWTAFDDHSDDQTALSDEGIPAISINLTTTDVEYLNFLNKLGQDIINEPAVARQFANDPNVFIQQYGYEGEISLDEGMLKLILTLGDEEINAAVNQNDVNAALTLMQEKGYLNDINHSNVNLSLKSNEVKDIYNELGIEVSDRFIDEAQYGFAAVWPVYVIAAVVSQLGVGYNVIVGVNSALAVVVYVVVEAWGITWNNVNHIANANLSLKIWSLRGQDEISFVATNQYITDQSKKITDLVKEYKPELLKFINEKNLEQLVKLNILYTNKLNQ